MLRGAKIDLDTANEAGDKLGRIYVRDLQSRELSDDAIGAVNTVVRCLIGALEKVTNEVHRNFAKRTGSNPYFPIVRDPSKFPDLLEKNLSGLQANHPHIAAAFERHQPYHPGHQAMGYLKHLYRVSHHHDFVLQERLETQSSELRIGGRTVMSMGSHGMSLGGPPPWRGIPTSQTQHPFVYDPGSYIPDDWFVLEFVADGGRIKTVRINGQTVPQVAGGVEGIATTWIDWYFVKPKVSVFSTLIDLHKLCSAACEDIWSSTGL